MSLHPFIDDRGRGQRGLITRPQLLSEDVSPQQVDTAIAAGLLDPLQRGVFRTAGTPTDWRQAVLAACLAAGPGAVASHRAAAAIWGLHDAAAPVEITVPYEQCPEPRRTVLHRSTDLIPEHCTIRQRIPVTIPARVAVDAGAVLPFELVKSIVEVGLYKRYFTVPGLHVILGQVARRGRNGCGVLRHVLEQRALGDKRPESLLEPLMADLCKAFGVRDVHYQYKVVVGGKKRRMDFAVPDAMVGLEILGLEAHATREALDDDLSRKNDLQDAGWLIREYTVTHLRQRGRRHVMTELIPLVESRRRFFEALAVQETANPSKKS